jgi:hypothetical protein
MSSVNNPQRKTKFFRSIIWVHATYILITAVWPLVDIDSFMLVTGPKRDVWLVKTVAALLIPVSVCLFSYLVIETDRRPAVILGSTTALAFMTIDFYYALGDVISDIYLADGAAETVFLAAWLYAGFGKERKGQGDQPDESA